MAVKFLIKIEMTIKIKKNSKIANGLVNLENLKFRKVGKKNEKLR